MHPPILTPYLGLSIYSSLFLVFRDAGFYSKVTSGADKLHRFLINKLLNVDMLWFYSRTGLKVTYKLSYDMNKIDTNIPELSKQLLESTFFCIGGLIILNYVYFGAMIIVTIIAFVYYNWVRRRFRPTMFKLLKFRAEHMADMQSFFNDLTHEIVNYRLQDNIFLLDKKFYNLTNEM